MEAKLKRWGEDLVVRLSAGDVRHLGVSEGETVESRPGRLARQDAEPRDTASAHREPPRRRNADGLPIYTIEEMLAEAKRLGPDFDPPTIDWGPDRGSEIIDDDDPR